MVRASAGRGTDPGRLSSCRRKACPSISSTTLEIEVLAGRVFSRDRAADIAPSSAAEAEARSEPSKMVLDRKAAERLGWPNPAQAVGEMLYSGPDDELGAEVIGVVESKPLTLIALSDTFAYQLAPNRAGSAIVAIARRDLAAGLAAVDDAGSVSPPTIRFGASSST